MVSHAYPRGEGDIAGVFIERLAVALVSRGHHTTVIVPSDTGAGGRSRRRGVEVLRVRYAPAARETLAHRGTMQDATSTLPGKVAFASLVNAQARAVARIRRHGLAQVVHAHWWVPGGVATWLARFTGGGSYLVTLHGTDVAVLESSRGARMLARRVLRGAQTITAVSSYLAQRAASLVGVDAERIVVQPMPADVEHLSRASQGGGGVVTVGRLVAQKRVDLVLDAVARLRRQGRTVRLTVVGDGPERGNLEARARELGIDNLTKFCGSVPPAALAETIGNADVMAFPARREGLGLAAAESFMLGIPVVACMDGGGVVDVVPADGPGRVVAGDSVTEFANALDELIRSPSARSLAQERGRLLRHRLDPEYVAQTYEEVYSRMVRRKRR